MDMTVRELAALVGGTVHGAPDSRISGMKGIREAGPLDVTFLADPGYERHLASTQAGAVLVPIGVTCPDKTLVAVADPRQAVFVLLKRIEAEQAWKPDGIHPTAVLGQDVRHGTGVCIGAHVSVGDGTEFGDGVVLHAGARVGRQCRIGSQTIVHQNVTIGDRTVIGARCVLNSGAVIGADGFGYAEQGGVQIKIPQVGAVVLGDDVEVGANSCIDRATFGATVVGDGSKIDNLVQIGHNVQLGRNCIVCGKAGIAGSTVLGDNVTIGAAAGINGHIEIGDGAKVAAFAGVTKSVKAGAIVSGFPAVEVERHRRKEASLRQLPDALQRIKSIEQRLAQLEGTLNGTPTDDR